MKTLKGVASEIKKEKDRIWKIRQKIERLEKKQGVLLKKKLKSKRRYKK